MESGTGTGHLDLADHGEEYRFRSLSALGSHRRVDARKFHEHELSEDHSGCCWENGLERLERNWITGPRSDLKH